MYCWVSSFHHFKIPHAVYLHTYTYNDSLIVNYLFLENSLLLNDLHEDLN